MNTQIRFLIVRLIRKLGKFIDYRIDFGPRSINDSREAKANYLSQLCERTNGLAGDIVECGLGGGFSFSYLCGVGERTDTRVWGFDSFEGFPKPSVEDSSSYIVKAGDWGDVDLSQVRERVLKKVSQQFFDTRVTITPGFFNVSIPKVSISQIRFLHLDGDLYQSYIDCLALLYDKVVPGGMIALDECLSGIEYAKYPGGFIATSEFFKDKDVDLCRDWSTGKYYVRKNS